MKTAESYEKDEIGEYLAEKGAWFFKPYMSGYGRSGIPDIVACLHGVFIGVEVKREGKDPTKIQDRRMMEIRHAGGLAFWGTASKVIAEIEQWRKFRP